MNTNFKITRLELCKALTAVAPHIENKNSYSNFNTMWFNFYNPGDGGGVALVATDRFTLGFYRLMGDVATSTLCENVPAERVSVTANPATVKKCITAVNKLRENGNIKVETLRICITSTEVKVLTLDNVTVYAFPVSDSIQPPTHTLFKRDCITLNATYGADPRHLGKFCVQYNERGRYDYNNYSNEAPEPLRMDFTGVNSKMIVSHGNNFIGLLMPVNLARYDHINN